MGSEPFRYERHLELRPLANRSGERSDEYLKSRNQPFKIGEGFWALGFATAVLIKPIFGNGDLIWGAGGDGSRFCRYPVSLFPNRDIWGGLRGRGKGPKRWIETKNAGRRSLVVRR